MGVPVNTDALQVINIAKISRTENLYPVLGSIFSEYSLCNHNFAVALQKSSIFDEKLYFSSLPFFGILKKTKKINFHFYFFN